MSQTDALHPPVRIVGTEKRKHVSKRVADSCRHDYAHFLAHQALSFFDVAVADVLRLQVDEEGSDGDDEDDPGVADAAPCNQQHGGGYKSEVARRVEYALTAVLAYHGVVYVLEVLLGVLSVAVCCLRSWSASRPCFCFLPIDHGESFVQPCTEVWLSSLRSIAAALHHRGLCISRRLSRLVRREAEERPVTGSCRTARHLPLL